MSYLFFYFFFSATSTTPVETAGPPRPSPEDVDRSYTTVSGRSSMGVENHVLRLSDRHGVIVCRTATTRYYTVPIAPSTGLLFDETVYPYRGDYHVPGLSGPPGSTLYYENGPREPFLFRDRTATPCGTRDGRVSRT